MSEQTTAAADGGPETKDAAPEYRVSHLMEDIADAFSERGMVQTVAPLGRGGIKPRVENRVTFQYGTSEDTATRTEIRQNTERVLETESYAWTTGDETRQIIVLGRDIADLRELRKGDRIHINKRRGPFRVYRVMDRPPEVLQRSDPAVTVELSNVDTDTDWMLVQWEGDAHPWAYCKTRDRSAKGGHRHRKVEKALRLGRVGPFRMYAPSHDYVSEDYQSTLHERVQYVADHGWTLENVHRSDLSRVLDLLEKPPADVFSPRDADLIRSVCVAGAEAHHRQADAVHIEDNEDRADAQDNQQKADILERFADAFDLMNMDAIPDTEDARIHVCADCRKSYTNRFKYPTHRRECEAGEQTNEREGDT